MKALGIIRRLDNLGRVVIPKEARDVLGLDAGSPVEIFLTTQGVFIRPYRKGQPEPQDTTIEAVRM